MTTNKLERQYLKTVYKKISDISPTWGKLLEVDEYTCLRDSNESNNNIHRHMIPKYLLTKEESNSLNVVTQSVSVNLLLRPEIIGMKELNEVRNIFLSKPWSFHHKFQILDVEQSKIIARQTFYELSKEYPLFSPSISHQGPSIFRFNIFVKEKFSEMKKFYSYLLKTNASYEKQDFCYFVLNSKNGFEVQLSLKCSKQLYNIKTRNAFVKLRIDNVYETLHEIGTKIEQICCSVCGILVTRDPENNPVLIVGRPCVHDIDLNTYTVRNCMKHFPSWKCVNDSRSSACSNTCSEHLEVMESMFSDEQSSSNQNFPTRRKLCPTNTKNQLYDVANLGCTHKNKDGAYPCCIAFV